MAEPVTWGIIIATIVAGGATAHATYEQGKAQNEMSKYNAAVAEREGEESRKKAAFESTRSREEGQRLRARQRALLAKSGVVMEGTPLLVMADSAAEEELDRLMIEREGGIQGRRFTQQAHLDRMAGRQAHRAGTMQAGATLLQTGASAGQTFNNRR